MVEIALSRRIVASCGDLEITVECFVRWHSACCWTWATWSPILMTAVPSPVGQLPSAPDSCTVQAASNDRHRPVSHDDPVTAPATSVPRIIITVVAVVGRTSSCHCHSELSPLRRRSARDRKWPNRPIVRTNQVELITEPDARWSRNR